MPGIVLSRVELGAGYPGDYAKIVDGRSKKRIGDAGEADGRLLVSRSRMDGATSGATARTGEP